MPAPLLPLILSRKPRHPGDPAWADAPSWFGGRPALGNRAWPRTSPGKPMTFLAQVNLQEIAQASGPSALPSRGALSFFVGAGEQYAAAAVLHVEEPGAPTDPPADAPAAFERGGDIFPAEGDPSAPRVFPRWPLDITPVPALAERPREEDQDDEWLDRRLAAVDVRFRRRQFFLSARHAWETLGATAPPGWWHTPQLVAEYLEAALRHLPARIEQQRGFAAAARAQVEKLGPPRARFGFGRRQAEPTPELKRAEQHLKRNDDALGALQAAAPDFARFVAETAAWARREDPWTPLPPAAAARLKAEFERSRKEFGDQTRYRVPGSLDDIETETLREMMTGSERAFAALPAPIRTLINESYLLPSQSWHQMFGAGIDIQGNAGVENEGNVMLLQLVHDDMLDWRFGDMGAYQFWIPPADLAAGRWKTARVTFECH